MAAPIGSDISDEPDFFPISRAEWIAWAPLVLLALLVGLAPALVLTGTHDPIGAITEALR